ncbi:MAG: helix-turn-helix transcriptional regulator [Anaerolineae bacterium]|nr:helix-turn-helix transcriptional regulator [Anaerolineae bacterium]
MVTAEPLLSTKIAVPPVQHRAVRRERLLARLTSGLSRRLTLVSAPAGFGKTTLVSAWVSEILPDRTDLAVAWLSLDEEESDVTRFLGYVLAAFSRAVPELASALPAVGDLQPPVQPTAIVSQVINVINSWTGELVLVLDDYHLVSGSDVHDSMSFLLDHLPANLHLVILTRADPPLPLSRLRGRGQLTELRTSALRFSEEEALTFLHEVMGIELSPHDVARLTRRTEGWPVGLQMAALSMRVREDVASFIEAFAGSHRYVMDYLLEEVWEQQPGEVQDFLLCTSVLDEMTASLCDAVCGTKDRAQEMLVSLEHRNLFIVPLDEQRVWFRYHRLFSDLLQQRLQRLPPAEVRDLHRRASAWYETHGMAAEAIEHALTIEDYDRAADLICDVAESILARSELTTFSGWIDALPPAVRDGHPALTIYIAWTQFWQGRAHHQIEADLDRLSAVSDRDAGRVAVLRSLFALYRGEVAEAIAYARVALTKLRGQDVLFGGLSAVLQLLHKVDEGDPRVFQDELLALARESVEQGNVLGAAMALNTLAELLGRHGYLDRSHDVYTRSLALACDDHGNHLPIAGQTLIGLATLAWMRGEPGAATDFLEEGIPLARQAGEMVALDGLLLLARLRQAEGDSGAAAALLDEAWQLAIRSDTTELDDRVVAIERARHWLATGDLYRARQWVEQEGLLPPDFGLSTAEVASAGGERVRKYEVLVAAAVLAAEGRDGEALSALAWAESRFEARQRPLLLIDTWVLKTMIQARLGRLAQARESLEQAVALASLRGYMRPFLDAGPEVVDLLRTATVQGVEPAFVGRVLSLLGETASATPIGGPAKPLMLDALTERELDVLRLLSTHLSSTEMAERLIVSANTVRTHIKSIYSKLDVHSRDEAVQRARELGLL